jgi:hypothetical protein
VANPAMSISSTPRCRNQSGSGVPVSSTASNAL